MNVLTTTQTETNPEECDWIQQIRQGDDTAFALLVERYQNAVYHLCYRMLGSSTEAEDAAQETFIRAYNAIERYDAERKFSTWLLSIATNYCIDQLRKRRLFTLSLDDMPFFDLADNGPGPEGAMIMDERQHQVRQLLRSLSETDRAAVVLRYWYDYSYDEIAEVLNLTNSAIKSRLHRARLTLAEAWNDQDGGQKVTTSTLPAHGMSYATQNL
jgi:RNA polymerase sigma-70 factor (ECF subfamily)